MSSAGAETKHHRAPAEGLGASDGAEKIASAVPSLQDSICTQDTS
jgi:hypothetical protein